MNEVRVLVLSPFTYIYGSKQTNYWCGDFFYLNPSTNKADLDELKFILDSSYSVKGWVYLEESIKSDYANKTGLFHVDVPATPATGIDVPATPIPVVPASIPATSTTPFSGVSLPNNTGVSIEPPAAPVITPPVVSLPVESVPTPSVPSVPATPVSVEVPATPVATSTPVSVPATPVTPVVVPTTLIPTVEAEVILDPTSTLTSESSDKKKTKKAEA